MLVSGLFYLLAILIIAATALPWLRKDDWWLRAFEFLRLQITILGLCLLFYALFSFDLQNIVFTLISAAVLVCVVFLMIRMAPYTLLYPVQMLQEANHDSKDQDSNDNAIKLMVSNVQMKNENIDGLVKLVNANTPDVLLVVETNKVWHKGLSDKLDFKITVAEPLENTYGMVLFSNYELKNTRTEYLVEDDVPSIHTEVVLPSGRQIHLHCLHPKPPAPQESEDTTERDAELLIVGKLVKQQGGPTIVAGDLNDVAWSYTTTTFQEISHLLDPRIGRGMYNTFHAKIPVLRFPLDHAFASDHFKLVSIKRLPAYGSDHFPMLIELTLEHDAPVKQDTPDADKSDKQQANKKIEKGLQEGSSN